MRKTSLTSLFVLISSVCILAFAGQNAAGGKFAGSWTGSWTGASTGKFEMTITNEADGKLSAIIVATPQEGDGSTFKSKMVETAENKLKVKFEDSEGSVEVTLEGALDGAALKGTYTIRDKAQGTEVESGTWTASRK